MSADLTRRSFLTGIAAAPLAGAFASAAGAASEAWPARPVTMVVPYGPGASNDTFTRAISDILSKRYGQPFVVDNRPGAGGFTGANTVVRATPDGYTFLEMPNSIAGFKPIMGVDLDPLVNLTPIAVMARAPTALVVNSEVPAKTLAEFIDYAKANTAKTFYGFAGIGTTQQQHMEQFKAITGLKIRGVNYKSSADAQTDLLAGRLQAMIVTVASTRGQIESGKVRLIAYTDSNFPPESLPGPTMASLGVNGMEKAQIWWGIFGPAGMAPDLVATVNGAVNEALRDPAFVALLAKSGATPSPVTPARFAEMIREENATVAEFAAVMKAGAN